MIRNLDEKTIETLFRELFTGLVQFAAGYVQDGEAAREIVQEALVNLWDVQGKCRQALLAIDLSKPVKAYLSTSVRNRCLNYLRDNRKFSSSLLVLENLPGEPVYGQSDRLVETDLKEQIGKAIAELPEKCREVFLLSRNRNMKYQEIASHLGISVKTVETQMSKALQHLRLRLSEYLPVCLVLLSVCHITIISNPVSG